MIVKKRDDNMIIDERLIFIFVGIISVIYACSWIYKIRKKPKPYSKYQYFYMALALVFIFLGISTFFTKCILNCLCGAYAGASQIISTYRGYLEDPEKGSLYSIIRYCVYDCSTGLILIFASFMFLLYFLCPA